MRKLFLLLMLVGYAELGAQVPQNTLKAIIGRSPWITILINQFDLKAIARKHVSQYDVIKTLKERLPGVVTPNISAGVGLGFGSGGVSVNPFAAAVASVNPFAAAALFFAPNESDAFIDYCRRLVTAQQRLLNTSDQHYAAVVTKAAEIVTKTVDQEMKSGGFVRAFSKFFARMALVRISADMHLYFTQMFNEIKKAYVESNPLEKAALDKALGPNFQAALEKTLTQAITTLCEQKMVELRY
jgi:hypothetical protein